MVYSLPACALGLFTLRCWMTCLRTLSSMVFAVLSPLEELFDNCAQTKELTSLVQRMSFRKLWTKKEYVHSWQRNCEFVFNAPSASHTGGVWERQKRTVCNILNAILLLCPGRLDDSSLRTVFYEAMSIVNCRPLTVSEIDNPYSLEPLTPNHILTGNTSSPLPPPGEFLKEDIYIRKRWRRVQFLMEQFWSRWRREYLAQITLRQKWHGVRRNIKEGDIVLVKDVDLPRNQWPLGGVIESNPDEDGLVRRVKVKLQSGILERTVHKLVLLIEN